MTLKLRILRSFTRLFIILVSLTRSLFSEKMLIFNIYTDVVWCPTWSKNLGRYLICNYLSMNECINDTSFSPFYNNTYHAIVTHIINNICKCLSVSIKGTGSPKIAKLWNNVWFSKNLSNMNPQKAIFQHFYENI